MSLILKLDLYDSFALVWYADIPKSVGPSDLTDVLQAGPIENAMLPVRMSGK